MPKPKPLQQIVDAKFEDVTAWAVAARVSDSLCYSALRGRLPQQPLLRESMARALGMADDAFAAAVAACSRRAVAS